MKSPEEALILFFTQVAQKNTSILTKLECEQCFDINEKRWQFFLPDLFTFLQKWDNSINKIDYDSFRKFLFNSPINQTVKTLGGEIVISQNHNNVDKSLYSLIWD